MKNPQDQNERLPLYTSFARLVENQIKIPVFIAQGGNDPRVTQAEAEQMVDQMKLHNIEHEYMLFPKEGHNFTNPRNKFQLLVGVEKFLKKFLG